MEWSNQINAAAHSTLISSLSSLFLMGELVKEKEELTGIGPPKEWMSEWTKRKEWNSFWFVSERFHSCGEQAAPFNPPSIHSNSTNQFHFVNWCGMDWLIGEIDLAKAANGTAANSINQNYFDFELLDCSFGAAKPFISSLISLNCPFSKSNSNKSISSSRWRKLILLSANS